jgi:probable rRNA maturation factor
LIESTQGAAVDHELLHRLVECVLVEEGARRDLEVGVVVTTKDRVHELNRQYRGFDEPTDVLSFSLIEGEPRRSFPVPQGERQQLGEVIISYPHVIAQAKDEGCSEWEELARLTIHGLLHLLGYDHEVDADAERMEQREQELLSLTEGNLA